jgi:hypothetical protein
MVITLSFIYIAQSAEFFMNIKMIGNTSKFGKLYLKKKPK